MINYNTTDGFASHDGGGCMLNESTVICFQNSWASACKVSIWSMVGGWAVEFVQVIRWGPKTVFLSCL